jgi:hypothetical protein
VHHDAKGRPDKFEARANYRDFDGRTRRVAAWGKTKTAASNSLRLILKQRVTLRGSQALKSSDRVAAAIEMFMANLQALVDEEVRSPGTLYTYRQHIVKNILPRMGEVRIGESSTPLVNKVIVDIKDEVRRGECPDLQEHPRQFVRHRGETRGTDLESSP